MITTGMQNSMPIKKKQLKKLIDEKDPQIRFHEKY